MTSYTIEQHVQMIKLYYQNECSLVRTVRALSPFYVGRSGPSKSTLQRLVAKFETTGSVNKQPLLVRRRNARSDENVTAVRESVQANPRKSIPRLAQELGLSRTSIWRILHRDLGLHPYEDEDCSAKGYVNKQNCRIWEDAKPREVKEELSIEENIPCKLEIEECEPQPALMDIKEEPKETEEWENSEPIDVLGSMIKEEIKFKDELEDEDKLQPFEFVSVEEENVEVTVGGPTIDDLPMSAGPYPSHRIA